MNNTRWLVLLFVTLAVSGDPARASQQVTPQDLETVLSKADALLEASKAAYENARAGSSPEGFIDAGFKLEEARIKYLVLQEMGSGERQKTAADRLRAVNQLSKLIHDGKVAVSGAPADGPGAAPPAKAPANPPPNTPPAPEATPATSPDVTKRAAVPEASKQKEPERLIRELFKEQYAKKAPADRRLLGRMLIDQAGRSRDDLASVWVLLREAQEISAQVCAVATAFEAIELASALFDIDPVAAKNAAIAALAKSAKAPDDYSDLAEAAGFLIEDMITVDQFDQADKLAASALSFARKAGNVGLVARFTARSKEVAEAKILYQAMKGTLETLARTPDDPAANLEMGRFLCYVKGTWDLGLRFMMKGSDPALKALAEKELAGVLQASDRVLLGDAWFDLAEKEKSTLRKNQLQLHARAVYETALPETAGLVRARIEKRIADLGSAVPPGPLDLLKRIDLSKDTVAGSWKLDSKGLTSPIVENFARIHLPYQPPEEYDLRITLERREKGGHPAAGGFYLGLVKGDRQIGVELDSSGTTSRVFVQPTLPGSEYRGALLADSRTHVLLCKMRKTKLEVRMDDKVILDWTIDLPKTFIFEGWKPADPKLLLLGAVFSTYQVKQLTVNPVSGPGKLIR